MAARIFVFGSYFADMVMATPRLPRRGETIAGGPFRTSHGGKGSNQAVAARRAGAEVVFATRLGDDDAGRSFSGSRDMVVPRRGRLGRGGRGGGHESGRAS
ncbi:MAG: PfkB family carbohydrate kinase [Alphaproteobacteria bacterium]